MLKYFFSFKYTSIYLLLVTVLVLCTGCSSGGNTTSVSSVASVTISSSSILMTSLDESVLFKATVVDTQGKPVDTNVTWRSSHETTVIIGSDGNATAQGVIGSTLITAEAGGITSEAVLLTVSELVGGAITIDDKQVIGDIEPIDPLALPGIGLQYKVKIADIALPDNGDIIVGKGELPVAGKVVSAEMNASVAEIVLEVVPVEQIFTQLEIHEDIDLSNITPEIPKAVTTYYTMTETADGSYLFTLKDQVSPISPLEGTSALSNSLLEFNLGPFECTFDGGLSPFTMAMPASYQISHHLHMQTDFSQGISQMRAAVVGDLGTEFKVAPVFTRSFDAKAECNLKLLSIPVPVGGAISWFFGFKVPIGVGFAVGGQIELAQLGYEAVAQTQYDARFGLDCSSGMCMGITEMENRQSEYKTRWILPNTSIADNLRLKPEVSGYGFANLNLAARMVPDELELVVAKGGLSQGADLALIPAQIEDTSYSSDYKLSLFVLVGSGESINDFISMFVPGTFAGFEYKLSNDLASSPKVLSFTSDTDEYIIGDTVTFNVTLDASTVDYLFGYNVDKIKIYKREPDGQGGYDYVPFFDMLPTAPEQTEFEREWLFTRDGSVKDNFYALIESTYLPTFGEFGILEGAKVDIDEPGSIYYIGGEKNLYTVDDDGIDNELIASIQEIKRPSSDGYPKCSPDGYKLAYEADDYLLSWVDLKSAEKHDANIYGRYFDWFPDSEHLLIYEYNNGSKFKKYSLDGVLIATYTVNENNSEKFSLSPDGTKVLYSARHVIDANNQTDYIGVLDFTTGSSSSIIIDGWTLMRPVWSSDGNSTVMSCKQDGVDLVWSLCKTDASGQDFTVLVDNIALGAYQFSPDSERIFYQSQDKFCTVKRDGTDNVCYQNVAGVENLSSYSIRNIWSPDSKKIILKDSSSYHFAVFDAATMSKIRTLDYDSYFALGFRP